MSSAKNSIPDESASHGYGSFSTHSGDVGPVMSTENVRDFHDVSGEQIETSVDQLFKFWE